MTHEIHGFIARASELRAHASELGDARVISLDQGYGFLPVAEEIGDFGPAFDRFRCLSEKVRAWAERTSLRMPIAFIETEYWGGTGSQAAIAWSDGRIVEGPARSPADGHADSFDAPMPDASVPTQTTAHPINDALRRIGVVVAREHDEFDALGLGRCRTNDEWQRASQGA